MRLKVVIVSAGGRERSPFSPIPILGRFIQSSPLAFFAPIIISAPLEAHQREENEKKKERERRKWKHKGIKYNLDQFLNLL